MAAAAPVALALAAAGTLAGGIEQNRAARAGARVDEQNAQLALLEGEQQALQTRRDERMQAGDMLAAMAGGGFQLGTGSAADVLAESAYQRELEIFNVRTRAVGEARNLNQSAIERRKAGKGALIGSVFSAAATAIKGVSDMRGSAKVRQQAEKERGTPGGTKRVPRMRVGSGGY